MPNDKLEPSQKRQLDTWIEEVREHEHSALKWSETLYRIKISGYWRITHQTWPHFCDEVFGYAKAMAYRYTACGEIAYKNREKIAKEAKPPRTIRQIEEYGKVQHVRQTNLEYVGTENVSDEKPKPARFLPGGQIEVHAPAPHPTASQTAVRPPVSPALFNEIHAIVNFVKRAESKDPSLANSEAFRHLVTMLRNLENHVQIILPGMETVCANEVKPKSRATLEQLREFCVSLNLPADDGDWFYDKMLQHGWKVDGKPVNDVYATIRNWNRMKIMCSQKQTPYGTKTNALAGKNSNGRNSIPDYSKGF